MIIILLIEMTDCFLNDYCFLFIENDILLLSFHSKWQIIAGMIIVF